MPSSPTPRSPLFAFFVLTPTGMKTSESRPSERSRGSNSDSDVVGCTSSSCTFLSDTALSLKPKRPMSRNSDWKFSTSAKERACSSGIFHPLRGGLGDQRVAKRRRRPQSSFVVLFHAHRGGRAA